MRLEVVVSKGESHLTTPMTMLMKAPGSTNTKGLPVSPATGRLTPATERTPQ